MSPVPRVEDALLAGGVGVLPTDTVYGLAAALDVPAGVAALYDLKGRPRAQPCQVLLYAPAALAAALDALPAEIARAAAALLPGPATCLAPDTAGRFAAAAGESPGSVGLRAPRLPSGEENAALASLAALELPLVATSANRPGGPDPARLEDVPAELRAGAAVEVDAGTLPGTASAVVDLRPLARGGPARLLRAGPDPDAVAAALATVGVALVRDPV